MNKISVVGRLTGEPVSLASDKTESIAFSIADNTSKGHVNYFDCVAFSHTAKYVKEFLAKGNPVTVFGTFECEEYQSKDGKSKYDHKIIVDTVQGMTTKPAEEESK